MRATGAAKMRGAKDPLRTNPLSRHRTRDDDDDAQRQQKTEQREHHDAEPEKGRLDALPYVPPSHLHARYSSTNRAGHGFQKRPEKKAS